MYPSPSYRTRNIPSPDTTHSACGWLPDPTHLPRSVPDGAIGPVAWICPDVWRSRTVIRTRFPTIDDEVPVPASSSGISPPHTPTAGQDPDGWMDRFCRHVIDSGHGGADTQNPSLRGSPLLYVRTAPLHGTHRLWTAFGLIDARSCRVTGPAHDDAGCTEGVLMKPLQADGRVVNIE